MSDPDRLAEITEHLTDHQDIHEDDGWWLVGEVERLRQVLADTRQTLNERERGWQG